MIMNFFSPVSNTWCHIILRANKHHMVSAPVDDKSCTFFIYRIISVIIFILNFNIIL